MNVLFLTLADISSIEDRNIYADLLRVFAENRHKVYIASPVERKNNLKTGLSEMGNVSILKIKTGNIQKANLVEKGISTLLIERQFLKALKTYFGEVKFDLILYSTPPITFVKPIQFIKNRDEAYSYLLLKDIFPQNAVDLGILSSRGVKGILYNFFRQKEKHLYAVSNKIGCMSEANVSYVLEHNSYINPSKVEVCPNTIAPGLLVNKSAEDRRIIRKKYQIPENKVVFVYGGNLGKPQGIPFLMECVKKNEAEENSYILIIGNGTEYDKLFHFCQSEKLKNTQLRNALPKREYEELLLACDVGLIFLNHCFTIPNIPSRLLSYMDAAMPVLAATDIHTDIGNIIVDGGFGKWCESNNVDEYIVLQRFFLDPQKRKEYGDRARKYLEENFTVTDSYQTIIEAIGRRNHV